MSAFLQDAAHIDVLVWFADQRRNGDALASYTVDDPARPGGARRVVPGEDPDGLTVLGRLLVLTNLESVSYRYGGEPLEDLPGPVNKTSLLLYAYRRPRRTFSALEGLKSIAGYIYQACEHPGWETSEAHAYSTALREHLVSRLPGYDDAGGWSWTEAEVHGATPAPLPARSKGATHP